MNVVYNDIVVQLNDIKKVFFPGTVDEVNALNGVNLIVKKHDFISVIGSNGAGKSTVLNIIAGVFPPEQGGILIDNNDVTRLPEYKHAQYVGRVWQDPSMGTASNLTLEENLSIAFLRGQKRGFRPALNKNRRLMFQEALTSLGLGLEDRLTALAGTLSGGQRQALSLIMATISKPSILLLDEHIATLDPKTAETVMNMTEMIIQRENMTAMMVTHNMEMALRFGDRLIMMHKGKIVVDLDNEQKKNLCTEDLINAFSRACGESFSDDKVLLSL